MVSKRRDAATNGGSHFPAIDVDVEKASFQDGNAFLINFGHQLPEWQ
jgi:hypothetical protein